MSTVGFLGIGNIGTAVAGQLARAGHHVEIANSRGPETLAAKVSELGGDTTAVTVAEVVANNEIVIIVIPFFARDILSGFDFTGKTVIDAMNYYPDRDGHIAELDTHKTTTSEIAQTLIPSASVTKAFNSIMAADVARLARPAGDPERGVLPFAGG